MSSPATTTAADQGKKEENVLPSIENQFQTTRLPLTCSWGHKRWAGRSVPGMEMSGPRRVAWAGGAPEGTRGRALSRGAQTSGPGPVQGSSDLGARLSAGLFGSRGQDATVMEAEEPPICRWRVERPGRAGGVSVSLNPKAGEDQCHRSKAA